MAVAPTGALLSRSATSAAPASAPTSTTTSAVTTAVATRLVAAKACSCRTPRLRSSALCDVALRTSAPLILNAPLLLVCVYPRFISDTPPSKPPQPLAMYTHNSSSYNGVRHHVSGTQPDGAQLCRGWQTTAMTPICKVAVNSLSSQSSQLRSDGDTVPLVAEE